VLAPSRRPDPAWRQPVKPPLLPADIIRVKGRYASLALAYAASDAYQHEAANLAVIDDVLDRLWERVELGESECAGLRQRFRSVMTTNRTAPGVMRIMALANEARISGQEAQTAHGRRERRLWRKHCETVTAELLKQVAVTLDALSSEPY
jgi:hypothetical protein